MVLGRSLTERKEKKKGGGGMIEATDQVDLILQAQFVCFGTGFQAREHLELKQHVLADLRERDHGPVGVVFLLFEE